MSTLAKWAFGACLLASALEGGCSDPVPRGRQGSGGEPQASITVEAGFVEVPARDAVLHGAPIHIGATAHLFYNFEPADEAPEEQPIFVLFNGFAANVVRGFGTGRTTVAEGGEVIDNPASLTQIANLVYLEPRQAGFSYDMGRDGSSCTADVFNEYVDAADVLLGLMAFLDAHPRLHGPVYWVGESYAGVRIQWLLAYLRGAWALAPYDDPLLRSRIATVESPKRLMAGQILLEPWLLGSAHAKAIGSACLDLDVLSDVAESVGSACPGASACSCATTFGRSLYNYTYENEHQETRVHQSDAAHTSLDRAERLFGVSLDSIVGLKPSERPDGFKCDAADSDAPSQSELVNAFGPLPGGQPYFLPYSPLQPGKELSPTPADWRDADLGGAVFVDNLHEIPTFVTDGPRDLVVPARALAPALRTVAGEDRIHQFSELRIDVDYDDGPRTIELHRYPSAGHMITMLEPEAFEADVASWLVGAGAYSSEP